MNDRPITHEVLPLIEALLDGTIDDAGFARLEAVLRDSAEARALYRSYTNLHAALPGIVGHSPRLSIQITDEAGAQTPLEPHEMPNDQLMDLLMQVEEQGEDLDPMALAAVRFQTTSSQTTSKPQYLSALSYVIEHTFTPRRVAIMATAAALLLGVVLTIVFVIGGDGTPEEVADLPDYTPLTPTPDPNRVVATITGQTQAVWISANGEGALPDRTLLGPNQRLTLARGFAEIMTNRGAVVLVQSPATIETTDKDNAIRLHRGKLVGRCDTRSSKGFVVHAPGLDVVDLGTEFGVEADAVNGSTVLVISGSVRAQPAETSPLAFEPVVLERGAARRVEPETGGLEAIAVAEAPVFYEAVPHPYVAAVLDAAPVAYWRFEDDRDRKVVNEIDPSRDNLSMVGPAALTRSGVIGKAGRLENRAEPYGYFETANPVDQLAGFDEGTIEFWYYADHYHKQEDERENAMLISLYDSGQVLDKPGGTNGQAFNIELTDNSWLFESERKVPIGWLPNTLRVYPANALEGEAVDLYNDQKHPIQRWQHVVLVKQDATITLYLDGEFIQEVPHIYGPIDPVSARLGHTFAFKIQNPEADPDFVTPSRPLMGRLDEVALYDKPLTAEQVARHHALATGGDSP